MGQSLPDLTYDTLTEDVQDYDLPMGALESALLAKNWDVKCKGLFNDIRQCERAINLVDRAETNSAFQELTYGQY